MYPAVIITGIEEVIIRGFTGRVPRRINQVSDIRDDNVSTSGIEEIALFLVTR